MGGMTETETKWAERVAGWRASGQTAPEFCKGKDFSAGGLRYWASKLGQKTRSKVRLARVVRGVRPGVVAETPIFIEVGDARLGVRRGFDPATLRSVLDLLGGGR